MAADRIARQLAVEVVRRTRKLMRLGPFNNRRLLNDEILRRTSAPRSDDLHGDLIKMLSQGIIDESNLTKIRDLYQDEKYKDIDRINVEKILAGQNFYTITNGGNKPMQEIATMAVMSAAAIKVEGGVCEKFALIVMGIISQIAPPGTIACKVEWSGDHHYIILKVPGSDWWVADPWVHNSFAHLWKHNRFRNYETVSHMKMTVHNTVERAFGVEINQEAITQAYEVAKLLHISEVGPFKSRFFEPHNIFITSHPLAAKFDEPINVEVTINGKLETRKIKNFHAYIELHLTVPAYDSIRVLSELPEISSPKFGYKLINEKGEVLIKNKATTVDEVIAAFSRLRIEQRSSSVLLDINPQEWNPGEADVPFKYNLPSLKNTFNGTYKQAIETYRSNVKSAILAASADDWG